MSTHTHFQNSDLDDDQYPVQAFDPGVHPHHVVSEPGQGLNNWNICFLENIVNMLLNVVITSSVMP